MVNCNKSTKKYYGTTIKKVNRLIFFLFDINVTCFLIHISVSIIFFNEKSTSKSYIFHTSSSVVSSTLILFCSVGYISLIVDFDLLKHFCEH